MQRRFLNIFFFLNDFRPQPFDRPSLTTLHPSFSRLVSPSIRPPKIHWFPTIPEFIFIFLYFSHWDKLASRFLYNIKNLAIVTKTSSRA